jgi:hypothetical protein
MRLWADFNNIHHGNRTSTLLYLAPSSEKPTVGEQVELYDGVEEGEGNRCLATVINVRGSVVDLELDWSSWVPAEDEEEHVATMATVVDRNLTYSHGWSFVYTQRTQMPIPREPLRQPPTRRVLQEQGA